MDLTLDLTTDKIQKIPTMHPVSPNAKVYSCSSTSYSRTLAMDVKIAANKSNRVHALSTTKTPWKFARRIKALQQHNTQFLAWCRQWINEVYQMESQFIKVASSEPHIVSYDHEKKLKKQKKCAVKAAKAAKGKSPSSRTTTTVKPFDGIGTHQDGSYATIIMSCSQADEYVGGGTFFPHLNLTVRLGEGEVLLFQGEQGPYSAPHRAAPIAGGKRVLYLAFFKLKKKKVNNFKKQKKNKKKKKKKTTTGAAAAGLEVDKRSLAKKKQSSEVVSRKSKKK